MGTSMSSTWLRIGLLAVALIVLIGIAEQTYTRDAILASLRESVLRSDDGGRGPDIARRVNVNPIDYDASLRERMYSLISRKLPATHPDVISLVRSLLVPPSDHRVKSSRHIVETPQSTEALTILNDKRDGFFVEIGGYDGERSSNTLYMEQRCGWSGLLVEMDPYYYTQLLGKSRRAWSINACVSPTDSPSMMSFKEASGGTGKLDDSDSERRQQAPCFPLESIMLALNQTHVDFFSLDVEGFELEVLKTINFDTIDFTVLTVEYIHGKSSKKDYITFMDSKGYKVHKDIRFANREIDLYVKDFVFVKK